MKNVLSLQSCSFFSFLAIIIITIILTIVIICNIYMAVFFFAAIPQLHGLTATTLGNPRRASAAAEDEDRLRRCAGVVIGDTDAMDGEPLEVRRTPRPMATCLW